MPHFLRRYFEAWLASTERAAAARGRRPQAQEVILYKESKDSKLGVTFYRRDPQEGGVPEAAIISRLGATGPAVGKLFIGERIMSVQGQDVQGPLHAARLLRESEGYLKIKKLPKRADFDAKYEEYAQIEAENARKAIEAEEPALDVSEASRAALATSIALVQQWGEHWAVRELVANNDGRGFGMSFKPRRVGDRIWLEVHNLRAGSIAAEAGMELGDVLLGIGGAGDFPVTEEGAFQLLRKMPKRPDIVLVIGRRNEAEAEEVALRELAKAEAARWLGALSKAEKEAAAAAKKAEKEAAEAAKKAEKEAAAAAPGAEK